MERPDRGRESSLLRNQPYDESLEVVDSEEVCSPSPRGPRQSESRRRVRGRGQILANSATERFDEDHKPLRSTEASVGPPGISPNEEGEEDEDEDEEEESDDDDEDDSDDDDEPSGAPEGVYDPADYANLPVSSDIKELFQYITRYSPQTVELKHSLKPFIPDFIPAVGDIDAFLKVPRPDGKDDSLGLLVLDEPSVKQSEPNVLSLWLSEESKQHRDTEQLKKVTSVANPQSNPRVVESWVKSISDLHRSKPAASVQYSHAMPDIDSLMQEWPSELEEQLGRLQLPPASLECSAARYTDIICSLLDIPLYNNRIQSLHLLFSLYLEFRDSQHFTRRT